MFLRGGRDVRQNKLAYTTRVGVVPVHRRSTLQPAAFADSSEFYRSVDKVVISRALGENLKAFSSPSLFRGKGKTQLPLRFLCASPLVELPADMIHK